MLGNQQLENPTQPKFFTTTRKNSTPNWRVRIKQTQLVSQTSTILLQRHTKFWASLLKPLKLSSNFTQTLFHQILYRIQTQPKICLDFFHWAQKNLGFKPDIQARCEVIRILFGSDLTTELGRPILNSIIQDHPPAKIVPLLQPRRINGFRNISLVLESVFECYCNKQMHLQSLKVYQMAKQNGIRLSVDACNALLNLLSEKNELRLAWCCYASIIRSGILGNQLTWSLIAKILYKDGKFDRISRILGMGVYAHEMFDLMIDGYSKRGDFEAAFDYLNELCSKGIEPSFSTYSSILDGACRHRNGEVIENVISIMIEKGKITKSPAFNYDSIIKKVCDIGKTFAMDLFFKKAFDDNVELKHATYELMFRALLSEEGRVKDAIDLYNTMQEKSVSISESCYAEFVNALCKENPSQEISNLLVDIIRGGFVSPAKELSNYISKQCAEGQWREAEELMNLILNRGWLLDSVCCGSLMNRYCSTRRIDKAIVLHEKLEESKGALDVATYNVFLAALFRERRIEETIKVFDYMKTCKILNSESFALMIRGLCRVNELRKAMKLHDEMLELGLKPDRRTYKRLITGFK